MNVALDESRASPITAVLQANYIIDCGLRGNAAMRAFQDQSVGLIESVRTFGQESSKRLGLSYRRQEKEIRQKNLWVSGGSGSFPSE